MGIEQNFFQRQWSCLQSTEWVESNSCESVLNFIPVGLQQCIKFWPVRSTWNMKSMSRFYLRNSCIYYSVSKLEPFKSSLQLKSMSLSFGVNFFNFFTEIYYSEHLDFSLNFQLCIINSMASSSTFYNYCVGSSVNDILLICRFKVDYQKSESRTTQHERCETRSW